MGRQDRPTLVVSRHSLLIALAILAACDSAGVPTSSSEPEASRKDFPPPPQGKATLYVASGYIPDVAVIAVGASTVGSLSRNSSLRLDLAPGTYDVHARSSYSVSSLSITIAADSSTFVQLQYIDSRPWRDVLSQVSQTEGRALVSAARPVAAPR